MDKEPDIETLYSCKRKPDVMTWLAIVLFVVMILLQIYMLVFLPSQVKKAEILELNIARDQYLKEVDGTRNMLFGIGGANPFQEGEINLHRNAYIKLIAYSRNYEDYMTLGQFGEMTKLERLFRSQAQKWQTGRFSFRKEMLPKDKCMRILEQRIQKLEEIQREDLY